MERIKSTPDKLVFQKLKIAKKEQLTKTVFSLEFEIPAILSSNYRFKAGQYVTLQFLKGSSIIFRDYSITNAPQDDKLCLAIKIDSNASAAKIINEHYQVGDYLEISEPRGRFTIATKPHEFRTIIAFATGIGITPIISHLQDILNTEPRSRLFLFYGNRYIAETVFRMKLDLLVEKYADRFSVYYFYTGEEVKNAFLRGRLDEKKLEIIINQFLHLDDTDEESTIWDAVDEVLICGKGEMIKSLANACFKHGIPKKNIHFELFEDFNQDIYPVTKEFPVIENINIDFTYKNKEQFVTLKNNSGRILSQLLALGFEVPYSCRSGLCGSCECVLENGEVELLENEYLTESEVEKGHILPCMSVALSQNITLNFDTI